MRIRPTVRLRLTLLYGGLFLLAGAMLLVVNYGLVRSSLPPGPIQVEFAPAPEGLPPPDTHLVVGERAGPAPLDTPEGRRVQTVLERSAAEFRRRTLDELVTQSASALAVMAVVSIAFGWVVAGRVLHPLHHITATARRLSEQNLNERIALDGPSDELKELADTFDEMLARLDAAFQSQGRFIANASHELRTPLAIQRTLVDVALADPSRGPEEMAAIGDELRAAIDRSEQLIDSLLVLARSERRVEDWRPVDLAGAAADAIVAVRPEAEARGLRIDQALGPAGACGDPPLLERAVSNLVENAVRHNVSDGWVVVTTRTEAGRARVDVANTGREIGEDDVEGLFEPFRRLERDRTRSRQGAGLGLSIVQAVVHAHGGDVRARPRVGGGLEVELVVPTEAGGGITRSMPAHLGSRGPGGGGRGRGGPGT